MADHKISIKQVDDPEFENFYDTVDAWDVSCSCGDFDERRTTRSRAEASAREHLAAVGEPVEESVAAPKKPAAKRTRSR